MSSLTSLAQNRLLDLKLPEFSLHSKHRYMPSPSSLRKVYNLEMLRRTAFRPSSARPGLEVDLVDPPNPEINRQYYRSVGSPWHWTDRLTWSLQDWQNYVDRDALKTFVGKLDGVGVGYFELEVQASGSVEIVYFGLLPDYIGKGLGGSFLSAAVKRAWELPGTKRVWLHTCTQDHKHALSNYQDRGFVIFKTELEPMKE